LAAAGFEVSRQPVADERFATAFGEAAGEYERGRPGYPRAAIDALIRELRLERQSVVVDLAAGTGKLTRDLTARFDRVIAIEPLAEMRVQIARTAPTADALEGTAERLPLPDASADGVLVAQAFHWFNGRRALAEIARVLRPGGGLGLLWNTTPWEEHREGAWFALLDDLLERSRADLSVMRRHATGRWRNAFERDHRFWPLSTATFDNTQRMSPDDFLANLASRSYIARLESDHRRELLGEISELLRRPDAPMDAGQVVVPMHTDVYWTGLRGG
jgi:ubiquinone/menaquinone biosynthesis C-methylase UbiE